MIFQGLFNILDLYFKEIDLFYNNIDLYFHNKIVRNFEEDQIQLDELGKKLEDITSFIINEFINLGFDKREIENEFLDPFIEIREEEKVPSYSPVQLYEKKIAPIVYEILFEKMIDYIVDIDVMPLMMKFKSEGLLPIEFIMELRSLKDLFERAPEKRENLRKYVQIQEKIIEKIVKNKEKIEKIEDIEEPEYKLQLMYLLYRIIHFFHLQKRIDFSHIKSYIEDSIDEWLIDVPLVSLKNPDIYFCGIYLGKNLNVNLNEKKIKDFLLDLFEEAVDRYESPLIEATDGAYYFFKSTELMKLWLDIEKVRKLIKTDMKFFDSNYLKNLETSQLVVILKIYSQLGVSKLENETQAIREEIERRVTKEGIKQYRDGFVSAEATYYVLFSHFMNNTLDKLKEYNILEVIVSRIYRNLELLDFSVDTNYDLLSELFYSCESLKLFNCIETKEMIIHLTKYLFPKDIVDTISNTKEIIREGARFRHLKVNRITGDTIY